MAPMVSQSTGVEALEGMQVIKKTSYICVQMNAWTPHIWSYVFPFCLWSLTRCFAAKRLPSTHRLARSFLPLHSASPAPSFLF